MTVDWRTHPQGTIGKLWLLKPSVVFRARVNMESVTYPVLNIDYDNVTEGSYTDTEAGMTVLFGSEAGGDDLGRNRLRNRVNESRVRIGLSSRGKKDGEVFVTDNGYITVLDDYRVWWKPPRLDPDGTEYKDGNRKVLDWNIYTPPVAIAGVGYAGPNVPLSFSADDSYATAGGAEISGVMWDIKDGAYSSGSSADSNITVNFPNGFRWVSLTVTDSNGKSSTTRIPVRTGDDATNGKTIEDFVVTQRTHAIEGQTITFLIKEDIDFEEYPDGTLVMYWEEEYFDSEQGALAGPSGREHMRFIGWIDPEATSIEPSEDGTRTHVEITCIDVAGRLNKLPGFPLVVSNVVSPATPVGWSEMQDANIDKFLHYLLYWHSTALELAPFYWSGRGEDYPFPALDSGKQTLYSQVDERAQAIEYRLTVSSRGELQILPDPITVESDISDSLVPVETLTTDDYTNQSFNYERAPRVGWMTAAAIKARQQAIKAIIVQSPGLTPGQGSETDDANNLLCITGDQMRERGGKRYARLNSHFGDFTFELVHGNDNGIEPLSLLQLTIEDFEGVRGRTVDALVVVKEVSWTYNHEAGSKRPQITAEYWPQDAVDSINFIEPPGDGEGTGGDDDLPEYDTPVIDRNQNTVVFVDTNGYLYRTQEFNLTSDEGGPFWVRTDLSVTGTPIRFLIDPFSPYFLGTNLQIHAWLVTTSRLYRITNITGGTPGVSLLHTFSTSANARSMACSHVEADRLVVITYYPDTGTKCLYTTDGESFTEVAITNHYNTDDADYTTGAAFSPNTAATVYCTTPTNTDQGGDHTNVGYVSTDSGATWGAITPGTNGPYITPLIELAGEVVVPSEANGADQVSYFGRAGTELDFLVTFDGNNHTDFETDVQGNIDNEYQWQPNGEDDDDGEFYGRLEWVVDPGSTSVTDGDLGTQEDEEEGIRLVVNLGENLCFRSVTAEFKIDTDGSPDVGGGQPFGLTAWAHDGAFSFTSYGVDNVIANDGWQEITISTNAGVLSDELHLMLGRLQDGTEDSPRILDATYAELRIRNVRITAIRAERTLHRGITSVDPQYALISPTASGVRYGPDNTRQGDIVSASIFDRETVLFVGTSQDDSARGVWVSEDAGDTWSVVVAAGSINYRRGQLSVNTRRILYLYGSSGHIAFSRDLGETTPDDRRGNVASMDSPSPGEIVGMWGAY